MKDSHNGGQHWGSVQIGSNHRDVADVSSEAGRIVWDDGIGRRNKPAVGEKLSLLLNKRLERGEVEIYPVTTGLRLA